MRAFFVLLFFAIAAYGQQKRIAIVNTVDDGEPPVGHSELSHLTDKLREIALKTLPQKSYAVMTQQSIVAFLGSQDAAAKKCSDADGCLAKLGREINADYVGQGRIGRFGKNLTIKVELYGSRSGDLLGSFTGTSKDIYGLIAVLDKEAAGMFKMLDASTTPDSKAFTDPRDGETYQIVKIGSQTWMAKNLNYATKGSVCYENSASYCAAYGRLYDWNTAMRVCPKGWHLPTNAEWDKLYRYADGTSGTSSPYESKTAGKHLKAASGWNSKDGKSGNGTDKHGFSALPGGNGGSDGGFGSAGGNGNWWSASEDDAYNAYYRRMYYVNEYAYWNYHYKSNLFSVRCLQD